jgi:GT2 family glycosyltransferase
MVTFGRLSLLRETLETFAGTADGRVSLTVVDNGSRPDVTSYLASLAVPGGPIDRLALLQSNMGKPYAWNLGAAVAAEPCEVKQMVPPEFFLFCDSDLRFHPGWVDILHETYAEHRSLPLGVLSGFATHRHEETVVAGAREMKVLRYPAGCCMLMSAAVYADVGKFATDRLIRTVDTSYCKRLKARGYVNGCVHPASAIEHTGKGERTWSILDAKPRYRP